MAGLGRVTGIILAGGRGSRLSDAVPDRPKVLALVRGRPFLAYLLAQLQSAGVSEVVVSTGYRADEVEKTLRELELQGSLVVSREASPLDTGGAIRHALPWVRSQTALVLNGDSYCDTDLGAFESWHRSVGSSATLLLTRVENVSLYGCVDVDAHGRVVRFEEKGVAEGPGWISAGVYLIGRERLASIAEDRPVSLEREVFPSWLVQGLSGYRTSSPFIDIGTPSSYRAAERFFTAATMLEGLP